MSYAIIRTGDKQFSVEPGAMLRVPTIDAEIGSSVEIEALLAAGTEGDLLVGSPKVDDLIVKGIVVDHGRSSKIIVFKKKRRKQYKRKQGHRQGYTTIRIDSIGAGV
ncbi:MAG: 50S ribosomal protein L21 [Pyrinomonadaceae bacterium]